ncbi:MAG TPA: TDT family transporter [Streptosporangiaceae bacterium]|jgi:C4-dicarboxylate transporter/malic acid transport protein
MAQMLREESDDDPEAGGPRGVAREFGPNWFATVMGTGIVAVAGAELPLHLPGLRVFATVVWGLAALLLIGLIAAWAVHWARHPARARGYAANPVMAQFWGAPPQALNTVGAGALLLGPSVLGSAAAVGLDWVLWIAGAALGLVTACWIPYLMMTRHDIGADAAFGGWLMPVAAPMTAAATGALLVPHAPAGQARLTLLLACYAMFGMSLLATLIIVPQIWARLVQHKVGAAAMVPTLWIVLGPFGQSVTAVSRLGTDATRVLAAPYGTGAAVAALLYGVPVWGFAMLWLALAVALTIRTARTAGERLPFALTWWSFTFPVGTCVTGTIALADRSSDTVLRDVAVVLYVLLALAWLVVAIRTVLLALGRPPRSEGQPRSSAPTRSPAAATAAARTSATSAAVSVRSGARKRSA